MAALDARERLAPLRDVASAAMGRFPDLGYLAPHGVLTLPVDVGPVTQVRLVLPNQFLHLQSVSLTAQDGSDATVGATVTASSWYGTYGERFSAAALFDWDNPVGTVVHTEKDKPAWVLIKLARPVRLRQIRLRNVNGTTGPRAARLRVQVHTRWRKHLIFDGGALHEALKTFVDSCDLGTPDPTVQDLKGVLVDVLRADYHAARKALDGGEFEPEVVKEFRAVVNATVLPERELLWTIHGPHRAFRFWSEAEQHDYVAFTVEVAEALKEVTPHVSFGFGAVLSVVRDGALIPHDDDLDLIIGFEPHEAATLADGLATVTDVLEERGYCVRGNFTAHRQVGRTPRGKHLDVFVGLFEGDTISWYPGTRGALHRSTMYPTSTGTLLGVDCPLPADPPTYLATLYGEGWRIPDPDFAHRWDRSSYADLAGTPSAPVASTAPTAPTA